MATEYGQKCDDKSCSFRKNGKCDKYFGKCIKQIDNTKLIENNVKSANKLRKDKAKRKDGFFKKK